jgi:hypothetical protein
MDLDGELAFDPDRPGDAVEVVKQTFAAIEGDSRTYLVTGSGGGSGATTLALELCRSLAKTHRTCYLDLDDRFGCSARLGLPSEHLTWAGGDVTGIPVGGFSAIVSPGWGTEPPADLVAACTSVYERVVADTPANRLDHVASRVTAGVLVMAPSPPSAARARDLLDLYPDISWAVVTNRVGGGGEATSRELRQTLGRRIAIELPYTPRMRDAEDLCRIAQPRPLCRWNARAERLVRALEST